MDLPDFVHPLSSGVTEFGEEPESPAERTEVARRLDELAEHRARAAVSAQNYMVYR
jgi:hypothetical protein